MRAYAATKWDGVFSLAWISGWAAVLNACVSRHVYFEQLPVFFLIGLALCWGVGLLFAVSALTGRSVLNIVCALGTILGFILFLRWVIFPVR
jgi:hypothetical protein